MSQPLHTILSSFIRQWPSRIVMAIAFAVLCCSSFAATAPDAHAVEAEKTTQEAVVAGSGAEGAKADAGHGEKHAEHHGLPAHAPKVGNSFISNSMIVTWIVALLIIIFAQVATKKIRSTTDAANQVPDGAQNFWEMLVEGLYNFLSEIMGPKLAKATFWFFPTIFIFILAQNWFGLMPGIGTIGWDRTYSNGTTEFIPWFRGGNADLNMTAAMALTFFFWWVIWAIMENRHGKTGIAGFFAGIVGVLKHIFAPKGKESGFMKWFMIAIFGIVGVIEVISIVFRPVSLSFRLYGNVFAGENILESMQLVYPPLAWLIPVPFYFLEILVGLIQALVFMLLTAVFTQLICEHDEEHAAHHDDEHSAEDSKAKAH